MSRVRSNRVCFTLNNYDLNDIERLLRLEDDPNIQYAVVGQEIGESGTPHLQGFIHIKEDPKNCGIRYWKNYFNFSQPAHFENARGTDEQSKTYCTKDGPFFEIGTPGKVGVSRFEEIFECAKTDVEAAIRMDYEFGIRNINQLRTINSMFGGSKPVFRHQALRDWQSKALEMLKQQNDREILFVVDEEGGKGKSTLAKYIMAEMSGHYLNGGKHQDLAHAFAKNKNAEYIIFDMARNTSTEFWPYNMMEQLKNGMITSTKYDSTTIFTESKKIVVFSNEEPDKTKLTQDRYRVFKI